MALNDRSLGAARGVDMHPGVANPTTSSMNSDPLATNFASSIVVITLIWGPVTDGVAL